MGRAGQSGVSALTGYWWCSPRGSMVWNDHRRFDLSVRTIDAPGNDLLSWTVSDLTHRHREPELMDQPGLDPRLHAQALRGLRRVNLLSGAAGSLWGRIRPLTVESRTEPLKVLDVACGSGDLAIALARKAEKQGLAMEIAACDFNETALAVAKRAAGRAKVAVRFFQADVLSEPLPHGFDVVCCSLFLHHLEEDQAIGLLRSMGQTAGRMLLVSDLKRSRLGYLLAWGGIRVLSRSRICHVDGPLSVQGAFTAAEAKELAHQAGLEGARIENQWPQRYLLTWSRP